jgi:hypothetical protein
MASPHRSVPPFFATARFAAVLAAALSCSLACGQDDAPDGANSSRSACEAHQSDLTGSALEGPDGLLLTVTERQPATPTVGDQKWTVEITEGGSPLVGAADRITVIPFMPDHGHGTAVGVKIDEVADGRYVFSPINLRMPGYWDVRVRLAAGDAGIDTVTFGVCVE